MARVGIIGLGLVGSALAQRLIAAGFEVSGYDLDDAKTAALEKPGGTPLASAAQVAAQCERIVLSLPTSEVVAQVLEQIAGEARKFASREYLHALYKGDRMTPEERTKAIANVSRLTGLSKPFVTANELRIAVDRFAAELLRADRKTLALSDSRIAGFSPQAAGGGRGFVAAM